MVGMETLVLVAAVILMLVTVFYAWFTFKLLQETRHESSLYKSILEKQLKISAFPHLYCDVQPDLQQGVLKLEVYNVGNVPAYDIQVSIIGAYTEEAITIPTFLRTYVQPRYRKYPLQPDKVGYYGIRSSVRCPLLPSQKKFATDPNLPVRPVDIYAMVQYREILGNNYYQVYCFSDLDNSGNYRANILEPSRVEALERLHFYDLDDVKLPTIEKQFPYYVKDFIDLWSHSLSHRFTVLYSEDVAPTQEVRDA